MNKILNLGKVLIVLTLGWGLSGSVAAQSQFATAVQVNNDAITNYELRQRETFLRVINQRGDIGKLAREGLIEDRLKMQAARRAGISLTPDSVRGVMAEFAGRADQTLPQFIGFLNARGVDEATLRDFAVVGATWREVVRSRFAGRGEASAAEIDRALSSANPGGGLRLLLSEIILFAPPPERRAQEAVAQRLSQIRSISQFSAEARARSVSGSKDNGGRLPWSNLNDLPAPIRGLLASLRPGEVTLPLSIENAFVLFQLRDIQETSAGNRPVQALEYAQLTVPTGQVTQTRVQMDVCDDLYGIAKRSQNPTLNRVSVTPDDVPQSLAVALSTLDANETTSEQVGEGQTQITMLCGRTFATTQDVTREDIAAQLRQRRLGSLADGYLAELKAAANIVNK
ncbi:MAG: peptidylprolyl isomerase [Planktomarina sp.]